MQPVHKTAFVLIALALVAGCSSDHAAEIIEVRTESMRVADETAAERTIELTKGDSLSVGVDPEGAVVIVATVAGGKRDAGAYRSTSAPLLKAASYAANALTDPNSTVTVTIDRAGTIVSIGVAVTLRK